jgi:hypothetical protein
MRRRTYLLWRKLLTRAFILLLAVFAFYALFLSHMFTVTAYEFEGVPYEYRGSLTETFTALAGEKMLWTLPGNRVWSFHKKAMKREIMKALPNSKIVSIHPSGPHTLSIKVESYTPAFAMENGFALSKEGVVYKEVVSVFDLPSITIATSTTLTEDDINSLSAFVEKISAVLFDVGKIDIDEYEDIRFYDKSGTGYVAVHGTDNLPHAWSNIVSAIDTEPLKSKIAHSLSALSYLDARFGNKVFYKFTSGANSAIIPKTENNPDASSTATTTVQ